MKSRIPVVSVLIPSYNHAPFLADCLNSIQAQTLSDWEAVIIDDGSEDESMSILRHFESSDDRIRIYSNPTNLGTYGTEQRALELSLGRFVAVMNSDDLWGPRKLETQVNHLQEDWDAAFCYSLGAMVNAGGQIMDQDVHEIWPRSDPQEPLPFLLYENRILASGVMLRRQTLRFDMTCRYSGDWVALLEQSRLGHARFVEEPMTFWRQHDHNTYRRSVKQMLEEIRVRRAIHRAADSWFIRDIPRKSIRLGVAKNAMNLFALLIYFREIAEARKMGWNAVRWHSDKKSALKRTLSGYLGAEFVRNYFWHPYDLAISVGQESDFPTLIQSIQELDLR